MIDGKVVVINRNTPWMSSKDLAAELGLSVSFIKTVVQEFKAEIEAGRYSPYVVAGERYNFYAIIDFMTFRKRLKDKNMRKYVPPFKPSEIAELSGFCQKVVTVE